MWKSFNKHWVQCVRCHPSVTAPCFCFALNINSKKEFEKFGNLTKSSGCVGKISFISNREKSKSHHNYYN